MAKNPYSLDQELLARLAKIMEKASMSKQGFMPPGGPPMDPAAAGQMPPMPPGPMGGGGPQIMPGLPSGMPLGPLPGLPPMPPGGGPMPGLDPMMMGPPPGGPMPPPPGMPGMGGPPPLDMSMLGGPPPGQSPAPLGEEPTGVGETPSGKQVLNMSPAEFKSVVIDAVEKGFANAANHIVRVLEEILDHLKKQNAGQEGQSRGFA